MTLSRATLNHRPSPTQLLARVLETPELARHVQALPGAVLAKLIAEVGLEDAGELVALATTEQLAQVFDEDLWRSRQHGEDPTFDSERFLLWLEVLSEAGDRFVAERLAELPPDLVTLAFHRHVLVLPLDDLRAELEGGDEAEAAEKALSSCLSEELDDYQLVWRGGDGWDHVLGALLALDRDHHSLTVDLLERCAHLSREHLDDNGGLYEVLTADEMLESDLSADRETRRAERGFVAPSAAAGFLRLAQRGSDETPFTEHDPLTRGYFRDLARRPAPAKAAGPSSLVGILADAGVIEERAEPLRLGSTRRRDEPLVIRALRRLAELSPERFSERSEELAYLSNAFVAGATVDGRRLRPVEAVEHAIACVSLGLAFAAGARAPSTARAAEVLAAHPCDGLLRLAFRHARQAGPEMSSEALTHVQALLKTLKV